MFPTHFTKGGINAFTYDKDPKESEMLALFNKQFNEGREGWNGWTGVGGAVMQWNPEHVIGFAYLPFTLMEMDDNCTRAKTLQIAVQQCVVGEIPAKAAKAKTCTIF
jgi:hypothetical protein